MGDIHVERAIATASRDGFGVWRSKLVSYDAALAMVAELSARGADAQWHAVGGVGLCRVSWTGGEL